MVPPKRSEGPGVSSSGGIELLPNPMVSNTTCGCAYVA